MSTIPTPPAGLTWFTPFLYVSNVKIALTFYNKIMGFEIIFKQDDTDLCEFARLRYHNHNFTLNKEGSFEYPGTSPKTSNTFPSVSFYLYHEDVVSYFNKIKGHFTILQPLQKEWYGDLKCRIQDPFGYIWEIATPYKIFPADNNQ